MTSTNIDGANEQMIVARCNELARAFYKMNGKHVPDDYKFYEATHPEEVGCWDMAVAAYEHIAFTDVEDCLASTKDEPV